MTHPAAWDHALMRGRLSIRARLHRLRAKGWHIVQAAVAAGVAWFLAADVLGHETPFFAPIAAVVSLGTSFGQRWRRVAEVTFGVAIGVLVADLLVLGMGSGWWQMILIVALAMSTALLVDAGGLLVTQAAVQSIVVAALVPAPDEALLRWTDALVGGAVALLAATLVPGAPLRRPREQTAVVTDKIAFLLAGAARAIEDKEVESTLELLADARTTDVLIDELQNAAAEGLSVVRSSPFRARHRQPLRKLAELVEPLDLALRNTRVLVRRAAVAAYRDDPVPLEYAALCRDLAAAVEHISVELRADRMPETVRPELVRLAGETSRVLRTRDLSGEVVLAQLRSIIADLLRMTGLDAFESTDALPPVERS